MRKFTAALTTVLALAATSVAVAPAAHAAPRMESWTEGRIEDGKVYLTFHDHDDLRPEDVQIRIRRYGSDEVVATVGIAGARDRDLCAPSGCDGGRFLSEPAVLSEVGNYTTDVVFREGTADERIGRDRGDLTYGINPRLTLTTDYATDSWEHPLHVLGSLTAEDPVTHVVKPLADSRVFGSGGGPWSTSLRTDRQGRFADRPEFGEVTELVRTYEFEGTTESITVKRLRHDLKLTVDGGSTITAPAGSDIPVRGTVRATTESGVDKPQDGHGVIVDDKYKAPTEKDGSFAFKHSVGHNTSLTVGPDGSGWFNEPPRKKIALRLVPTKFVSLKADVDKYRKVTITGKPEVAEGSYPTGTTAPMAVQYSSDGRTWKTVDSFTGRYGQAFSRTPAQLSPLTGTGYWRVRVTEAAQNSPTLKSIRKATQLSNDDLTPEGVKAGTQITAKGGLLQQSGTSWKTYAGQKVRVYFKASAKGSVWEPIASTTTKADGTFSTKVTARRDGTWQIRYTDTPATHYADYGREDYVDVR
ncbi:hypothetical protein [Streptomyces sp. NBC_01244]|uniref:hypothetical protein n=1 Tax=Streptomyces sp. NBC_01244 TaxID=2903797 RepID=UPI002E0D70A4|nr:hypothetical protein OG247_19660 [Streptomyces sp. NBC_01244]